MAIISRRQFATLGGMALTGALAMPRGIAFAAQTAGEASAKTAPLADPLAPIAPELRPAAREVLDMMAKMPPFDAENLRKLPPDAGAPQMELLADIPATERLVPAAGSLPAVKVYLINSDSTKLRPAILHMHGGGFILGSAKTELRYLQEIARELDCVIVTVEYRLAPETRYNGSTEDNYAALKWLYTHAGELGVDRDRIALLGESAGGGHAALLAIRARDRGEVPLVLQALIYPMLDDRTGSTRPVPKHIATVGWDASANRFGWESFLGQEPGGPDIPPAAVPARNQNLSDLAPAFICVGGVDLFVEEDIEYARRLTLAGVPTQLFVVPQAFHGFDRIAANTGIAIKFTEMKMSALRGAFSKPS